MTTDSGLATFIVAFFGTYLPKVKSASPNTVRAYRDAVLQLLGFAAGNKGAGINSLAVNDLSADVVKDFLQHLEERRGVSIATRNHRLAAIHSFFKYIQKHDFSHFARCQLVLAIEKKRAPEPVVAYLSIEEMKVLLRLPDATNQRGLRHLAILSLLYESAARIQELIDIRVADIGAGHRVVTLHGKGSKTRLVPIGKETAAILKQYLKMDPREPGERLFTGRHGLPISRSGVQYIIDTHVAAAKENNPHLFSKKVTPHIFRHSRSMHLLESGVNLVYISDLLGHASVMTTEVYAKANPETKRKVIERHSQAVAPNRRYGKKEMRDLESWLKGIC
jgi:site-specific recombinase XerD